MKAVFILILLYCYLKYKHDLKYGMVSKIFFSCVTFLVMVHILNMTAKLTFLVILYTDIYLHSYFTSMKVLFLCFIWYLCLLFILCYFILHSKDIFRVYCIFKILCIKYILCPMFEKNMKNSVTSLIFSTHKIKLIMYANL